MSVRGKLNNKVKEVSLKLLGYEVCRTEMRLLPYIIYVMHNEQVIAPKCIDQKEREILSKYRKKGYIEGGVSGLAITKEFYDIANEIIFYSYVAYREYGEYNNE